MHSRMWGVAAAILTLVSAVVCVRAASAHSALASTVFLLTAAALVVSIFYTPDYLHLSVDEKKRQRWETRIRWRVIGAALLLALLSVHGLKSGLELLAAIVWLSIANWVATKLRPKSCAWFFWATDFILLATLLLTGSLGPLVGAMLLAAAACLSILITENNIFPWTFAVTISGFFLLMAAPLSVRETGEFLLAGAVLFLSAAWSSALLVYRAQRQNARNVREATDELVRFTGYTPEKVRTLWSDSNRQLAENWKTAAVDESDAARLADWYRENAQLYMFAISAYNLEYKRIRSNLKVLRFARGATLDYGAGNGEIVLELARRGHPVAYYDVEGETMKFARQRASDQDLDIAFFHTREALLASKRRFDTVFSFDVLEHLPDLAGELRFLSSLLNQGGLFLFDVPAGSTKAHPMHLNHNLGVREYMHSLGMRQERSFLERLSFRKEEKFFFTKQSALSSQQSAGKAIDGLPAFEGTESNSRST
jgi:2-polyprenyl-3-methyl-5-hydroxy-6-metoxy-1,4-benzoquinol methylase